MGWEPQCLDDLVPARHSVRTVAEVVAKLNLAVFREPIQAREGVAGRDATDPELLVALWLYACIRGIGSARELARRCEESAPFRWLCGGVSVNHRMLSDFRTDHGAALDQLFTQVIASLVDQELVSVSRISQDGVRVRVSAGSSSFRRENRLRKLLAESQTHVAELRQHVEEPGEVVGRSGAKEARATARGRGSAKAPGAGAGAVAGAAAAAGRKGRTSRSREIRAADTGKTIAGEHDRCGSARDENGQRRISPRVQHTAGQRPAEPRDPRR
jgi:transposase